jgi:hypothetical protein
LERITDADADRGINRVARIGTIDGDDQDVAPALGESAGGF